MKRLLGGSLIVAGGVQLFMTARVLGFAAAFRFLPAELLDREGQVASILAAIAAEAEMIA